MKNLICESSIVGIYEDGIVCKLCSPHRFFQQAGTHFSRKHGFPVHRGMQRSERLKLYGLPLGSRLSSSELREHYREVFVPPANAAVFKKGHAGYDRVYFLASEKQRSQYLKGAIRLKKATVEKHLQAIRKRLCVVCGSEFEYMASRGKKVCSEECQKKLSAQTFGYVNRCHVIRDRSGRSLSIRRKEKYWHSRKDLKYRVVRVCLNCKNKFSRRKSDRNKNIFCSASCWRQKIKSFMAVPRGA